MIQRLYPNNEEMLPFHMRGWEYLLEQCSSDLLMTQGARWCALFGEDSAVDSCGLEVTEEEAKIMARIARTHINSQRPLSQKKSYKEFAQWAEKSQGFKVGPV